MPHDGDAQTHATPLQCWPVLSEGRDIIAIAETGSGKTLGFALPGLEHIRGKIRAAGGKRSVPRMLVVTPTR